MEVIKTINDMKALSRRFRTEGKTIGFVPTMGALHEGHLSLVHHSKEDNDVTIVSIFINPTQFGPDEDFNRYPRDEEGDLDKVETRGANAVFMPESREIYPEGFSTAISVGEIGGRLCGASRPGHFGGVATVVIKFLNIVMPDRAYFGQKDFQQSVIIRKIVDELNLNVDIKVCTIVRENDGLAMSSRNLYLKENERKSALVLCKALQLGDHLIVSGSGRGPVNVKKEMMKLLESEPLVKIEYINIVDPQTLEDKDTIDPPLAICIAAHIGSTRLIDNIIIEN